MYFPVVSKYSQDEFSFPNRDIDPANKKDTYCRKWAEAIYSLWARNKCAWTLSEYNEFEELRLYAKGEQDIEQYKSWLAGETSTDTNGSVTVFDDTPVGRVSKREGWANILWQNISPAPMIKDSIHGMFDKADYDLYVDTIDADSRVLAEEQKYIKYVEAQNLEWQNALKTSMGIPIDETIVYPKSKEELDMFEAQDGFKLNVARAMQKLLRHSFNISDWEGNTYKSIIDDAVDIGYIATEDYFDDQLSKWRCRYLDPQKLVIQYSVEHNYSDSEYAGYFPYETISNLRHKLPDLTEDDFKKLASRSMGLYGNPSGLWTDTKYSELDPATQTYMYDGFKVPIFHAWWIDTDYKRRLYYKSFRGRESVIDLGWESEVKPLSEANIKGGATQEVKKIAKRQPYECYWVVDTEYVYDFGIIKMASRAGLSRPQLPVHVEQLPGPSLMKRMKPIIDQMTQAYLRYQNSLAMMVERGYAINTTMLGNVSMGGGKLKPAEVMKLWQQTGRLLYTYSASTGLYTGGAALPITPIDGGMGDRVKETAETFNMLFQWLEKLTGINPVALGVSPDPNAPVGTMQSALEASANVLKPIMTACYELKKSTGECIMRRIQIGIRNSNQIRTAYSGVISPSDMEAMRLMEGDGVQYGLSLKAKPDMRQKARFEKWIDIALQNTREQRPGIDLNDAIYFMGQLENGADLQDLEKQLEYAIEKNKQEAEAQSQRMIEAQGQQNAQNEQMKAENQIALDNNLVKGKINEEIVRGGIKIKQSKLEANLAMLQQLKNASDAEQGINISVNK